MRKIGWIGLITAGLAVLALNCAPKPTEKELKGSIKGKMSLRLTDGSPISLDDSDEYNPYLVKLSDNYLVLVFGSNRACGGCSGHNIFMAKSVTPYVAYNLPFFNPPVVVTDNGSLINSPSEISFAAAASSSSVKLYVNLHTASDFIRQGTVSNPSSPTISPALASITNSSHESNTITGISADGEKLITADFAMDTYIFDPTSSSSVSPFGFNLSMADSVIQVRFDNTGFNDSYLGSFFGTTFAATQDIYFGPLIDLDISVAASGLFMRGINTFYGDDAAEDLVLFTANDGFSFDLYVVTSHTAADLWNLAGFFGGDSEFLPPPNPAHWFTFDFLSCPGPVTDMGIPGGWSSGSCNNLTASSPSYWPPAMDFAQFGASSTFQLQEIGPTNPTFPTEFTISAWVYLATSPSCGTACTIMANSTTAAANAAGFRLYVDSTTGPNMQVILETGDGAAGAVSETNTSLGSFTQNSWHMVTAVVTDTGAWMYLDGFDVSSANSVEPGFSRNGPTFVGKNNAANNFTGDMDNVMVFDYALDPDEVATVYLAY